MRRSRKTAFVTNELVSLFDLSSEGAGGILEFSRSVNPIPTRACRVTDYAYITTRPLDF
jgi:hypothetical protein